MCLLWHLCQMPAVHWIVLNKLICLCILYNSLTLKYCRLLIFTLHSQYHACLWPRDAKNQVVTVLTCFRTFCAHGWLFYISTTALKYSWILTSQPLELFILNTRSQGISSIAIDLFIVDSSSSASECSINCGIYIFLLCSCTCLTLCVFDRHESFQVFIWLQVFCLWQNTWNQIKSRL